MPRACAIACLFLQRVLRCIALPNHLHRLRMYLTRRSLLFIVFAVVVGLPPLRYSASLARHLHQAARDGHAAAGRQPLRHLARHDLDAAEARPIVDLNETAQLLLPHGAHPSARRDHRPNACVLFQKQQALRVRHATVATRSGEASATQRAAHCSGQHGGCRQRQMSGMSVAARALLAQPSRPCLTNVLVKR